MKNSIPNPWAVELPCPQCGAKVFLEETDRILSCAYCRVRLMTLHSGYPQYFLEPFQGHPAIPRMFYLPYWRLRGLAFDVYRRSGKDRVLDASFLAINAPGLPPSLGLQARAFTLRIPPPVLKRIPFQITFPEVLAKIPVERIDTDGKKERPFAQVTAPVFIGESVSRILTPVYSQKGILFEGLGDRPIGRVDEDLRAFLPSLAAGGDIPPIRFLPLLCPYCGGDLEGEKDTWILLCRNCNRVWGWEGDGLQSIPFGVGEGQGEDPYYYLPFWRIPAPAKDPLLERRPRLSSLSVGSQAFAGGKGDQARHYWLPAFKLSPSLFLITARAVTVRQPAQYRLLPTLPKGRYYPVNLPWEEAAAGLLVLLADLSKNQVASWETWYPGGRKPSALLVFLPFRLQSTELVQEGFSVGVSQAALHFGRFI